MTDNQTDHPTSLETISGVLYSIGLIACAIGAILHLWLPQVAGWILFAGGLAVIFGHILSARKAADMEMRDRRLMRMNFLGGALYLVAGGTAIEGKSIWILFFIIGTVFTAYTVFALGRRSKGEEKH